MGVEPDEGLVVPTLKLQCALDPIAFTVRHAFTDSELVEELFRAMRSSAGVRAGEASTARAAMPLSKAAAIEFPDTKS